MVLVESNVLEPEYVNAQTLNDLKLFEADARTNLIRFLFLLLFEYSAEMVCFYRDNLLLKLRYRGMYP